MTVPRQLAPLEAETAATRYVWYAAFGSNLFRARLNFYLSGGTPPGASWHHPGCRDPRQPEQAVPIMLPGELYFALESKVWTGGVAFYDPLGEGRAAARAYLVTAQQFSDIAAQEMHREPGADLDLTEVLATGRSELGPGRYETLVCPGLLDEHPVLTFTAPWARHDVTCNAPSAAYLQQLAFGLAESHPWSGERIAHYLSTRPGAAGHWTADAVAALLSPPSVGAAPAHSPEPLADSRPESGLR
ncbi:histone deacetylase [Streptomyces albidus (ex Kaewkla and Franco 2022)]|uniref:histone deacetylase n=1 Tax=Streptomyces albidus (ex Kaewkla and Franco 2022) TaxID=722709 RepID=UPI001F3CA3DF|nr:histone deacetylase [Streptomyces albidus (ex Kaewkla and Franco 2022)]